MTRASKRKLPSLDRNEDIKKIRLNDTEPAQLDCQIVDTLVAATISNPSLEALAVIEFKVKEIVWAKIKGYPAWPARIQSFPSAKMASVIWFNDYRTTKIYRTQLFKFLKFFDRYSINFDKTIGLKKAALEGLYYYGKEIGTS